MPASTATKVACFSCGSDQTRVFYSLDQIPVHSCLLMPTREEAINYPKGNMRLAFCSECGFVQNSAFDPSVHEYSTRYEETQGFSPRFNQFAREIAGDYLDRYKLHGKSIMEIGCGKGEFLVLMCEMGDCSGIGIDPGYRPERTTSDSAKRIEFIQDFYSEKYTHLQADMVLCRHTLEHIQNTKEFMQMVRRSIGDRPETMVCFELPDIDRVLDEQGFWDIYYEHCSYFSLGSLSRLFKSSGFEVVDLRTVFDDQYLLIDAKPCDNPPDTILKGEDDLQRMQGLVTKFEKDLPVTLDKWRKVFLDAKAKGEKTAIWGSGSKAVAFLTSLGLTDEVHAVTDINPYRHNMFMPGTGHKIVPPEELKQIQPDLVVAMNPIYVDEIQADLAQMDLHPRMMAV